MHFEPTGTNHPIALLRAELRERTKGVWHKTYMVNRHIRRSQGAKDFRLGPTWMSYRARKARRVQVVQLRMAPADGGDK